MIKKKLKDFKLSHVFIYLFLSAMSIVMIFPLYWMLRGAFMESPLDVMDVTKFFPNKFDFGNFT